MLCRIFTETTPNSRHRSTSITLPRVSANCTLTHTPPGQTIVTDYQQKPESVHRLVVDLIFRTCSRLPSGANPQCCLAPGSVSTS
ncbi:hypothetical protein CERSUDRAFT_87097 [Gelatoporia subvermispora B]|uniref:Uncharacterized protein n=1 Tax=Ceriporiopsis subvermispora (strain B) TaxID=914234 RepID=M2PD98_CERS8|nr:hypothetical protein CERSUDRAFT_87097 [Gelatoporia subvermispora B]